MREWGDVMKKRLGIIFSAIALFFGFLAIFSASWYRGLYGDVGFDAILFTLFSDLNGADSDILWRYTLAALPTIPVTATVIFILFFNPKKEFKIKDKKVYPLPRWLAKTVAWIISIAMVVWAAGLVSLPQWLSAKFHSTTLYEEHFIDPNSTQVKFPEQKRNLVYIFLESMETSYFSKDVGGGMEQNLMPNLHKLAEDNLNFSHSENQIGGARTPTATTWTVAAMVSQTAGMPLKLPLDIERNSYGNYSAFLPGATTITDILEKEGYNQALMVGSDASFSGRRNYFSQHGIDNIYDLYTAYDDELIPDGYKVWWGFEDWRLFEYAKEKITEMSQGDEPFAFTLLTVDTHFVDGWVCEYCEEEREEKYENVIMCSDRLVYQFVEWLKTQPFYENTTVIVTGDHLTMDDGYVKRTAGENFDRRVYNCFLNSAVTPINADNRDFTTFDMFPTTLAAMGCEIEGERLGLGTNLFSSKPTLSEELGFEYLSDEIGKMSNYYNKKLLNAYK